MDNICKEGNLQLVFQDTNWTKIDSNAYADTCGKFSGLFDGFKLMDCSWFNRMTNTLWLIEVKQFYNPENPRHQDKDLQQQATINQLIGDLLQKSIATLLLLNERNKTSACFPEGATKAKDTKIASILIVKPGHVHYLTSIRHKLQNRFAPYNVIFGINRRNILVSNDEYANKLEKIPFKVYA